MGRRDSLTIKPCAGPRCRFRGRRTGRKCLTSANVAPMPPEGSSAVPAEFAACARLLEMVVADKGRPIFAEPHAFDDASWVGYRLAEILPVPLVAKQRLLELTDSLGRLSILQRFLESRGLVEKAS